MFIVPVNTIQVDWINVVVGAASAADCVIMTFAVVEHRFASVTVTV